MKKINCLLSIVLISLMLLSHNSQNLSDDFVWGRDDVIFKAKFFKDAETFRICLMKMKEYRRLNCGNELNEVNNSSDNIKNNKIPLRVSSNFLWNFLDKDNNMKMLDKQAKINKKYLYW